MSLEMSFLASDLFYSIFRFLTTRIVNLGKLWWTLEASIFLTLDSGCLKSEVSYFGKAFNYVNEFTSFKKYFLRNDMKSAMNRNMQV